jgi:hypothetical protein
LQTIANLSPNPSQIFAAVGKLKFRHNSNRLKNIRGGGTPFINILRRGEVIKGIHSQTVKARIEI